MRRYAEKRLQEEKEVRDLVQQVAEGHKNSKTAKERLQKLKQSIGMFFLCHVWYSDFFFLLSFSLTSTSSIFVTVKEVSEQSRELLRQALEEAQAELSSKFEINCEIRAIESLPHIRVKNFDDTEVSERKKNVISHSLTWLTRWPVSDCRPQAAGRDVPGRAEGAASSSEGGAANRAAGEAGAHSGGEAEQEEAAVGAAGGHRPPQESTGTSFCHQVRKMFGPNLFMADNYTNITHTFMIFFGMLQKRGEESQAGVSADGGSR